MPSSGKIVVDERTKKLTLLAPVKQKTRPLRQKVMTSQLR